MKSITIQPQSPKVDPLKLPYPFHIHTGQGYVGRQDFWKGEPFRLIGFSKAKKQGVVKGSIDLADFLVKPKKAIGMYPIFEHKNGEWYTYQEKITSVRINN